VTAREGKRSDVPRWCSSKYTDWKVPPDSFDLHRGRLMMGSGMVKESQP
jgi:hypothetical protein